MTLTQIQRRSLAGCVILAALICVLWKYGGESATAAPDERRRGRPPVEALPELDLAKLEIDKPSAPITNAFEPRSWAPPPAKLKLPPPPQAPPLPFTYLGKMMEDGKTVVFLASRDRSYAARSGDKLDGTYQIDDIKPTVMTLTYLPLNQQQSLAIGSAN